jgi:hypothetical protein
MDLASICGSRGWALDPEEDPVSRLIDLSIPLDNEIPADPPFQPVEIDYVAHDQGAAEPA